MNNACCVSRDRTWWQQLFVGMRCWCDGGESESSNAQRRERVLAARSWNATWTRLKSCPRQRVKEPLLDFIVHPHPEMRSTFQTSTKEM